MAIPLGKSGLFALVDAGDFALLSQRSWYLARASGGLYARMTIHGYGRGSRCTSIAMHRLLMNAAHGQTVDHINGNGLDNRRANLRFATTIQNRRNTVNSPRKKRGGFKGIFWNRLGKKWEARIRCGERLPNGQSRAIYLGLFSNPEDAARAYDTAARRHFGEFASLNFPDEIERGGDP